MRLIPFFASVSLLLGVACSPAETPNTPESAAPSAVPSAAPSSAPSSAAQAVDSAGLSAFQTQYQQVATTPQGAASMLMQALVLGLETPAMAEAYLSVVLRSDELTAAPSSPGGYVLSASGKFMWQQFQQKPQIVYSYVGATPDQDYKNFNPETLTVEFPVHGEMVGQLKVDNSAEQPGATTGRIYVKSSGKDSPTPINMDKNRDGVWKVQTSSLSNLATGVRAGTANAGNF